MTSRGLELVDAGSHFYRSDFQVHTPRDNQWNGSRPTTDQERKDWAASFVRAAREKGLHAVAISDHHDFVFFPYVKAAAAEETRTDGTMFPEKERLVVFPALELTLEVPCQAIMILDADFPEDRLDSVLNALHHEPFDGAQPSLPPTTTLVDTGDINGLHGRLDQDAWLKGRYIILPNVTPGGRQTLIRTAFQAKYRDMISVGGYLDGSISQIRGARNTGVQAIVEGRDLNYGQKRIAVFQTSDARTQDFTHLGEHTTWVKWATPTAEAIRQACLAQESRISQEAPSQPTTWLSHLLVSTSRFMGRVDVAINPQYTALIGGRGTGKSTVLDYIRWALCDQPAQISEDDDLANPLARQRKLIEATLKPLDATVEVHCVINGIPHMVRRKASDGSVELKVGDGDLRPAKESTIQSLLPIQAYSQKQLSSVAIRVDELMRFVNAPVQPQLEELDTKLKEVAGRLRENYGTLERARALGANIAKTELRAQSIGVQAKAMRDGLSGITDADRALLDSKTAHDDLRASEAVWLQSLGSASAQVRHALAHVDAALGQIQAPANLPAALAAETQALVDRVADTMRNLRTSLSEAADRQATDRVSVDDAKAALEQKLADFERAYQSVKERSSAHEAQLAALGSLDTEHRAVRESLSGQQSQLAALGDPSAQHARLRAELMATRAERTALLKRQCDSLAELSDGLIQASLVTGKGFEGAKDRFKGLAAGSSVRAVKIDAFFEQLAKETSPTESWELVLAELESLVQTEPDADITSEQTPNLSRLGFPLADQKRILPKLTPDGWLDLSLTEIDDYPAFEYRTKEGQYIAFEAASAGQQASALLSVLLSQHGMPLIIDQPEEDLDSATVQQIITKIWEAKSSRQLIFASHNPNLVVNGDADLVLVCAYLNEGDQSAGHIAIEGAIDMPAVRDAITSVMEGGEQAFKLRKEKYGF